MFLAQLREIELKMKTSADLLTLQLDLKHNTLLTYNLLLAILGVCFGVGGQIGGLFGGWR